LSFNKGRNLSLAILVTSSPGNDVSWNAIRLTWRHYSQQKDVMIAFILGNTDDKAELDGMKSEMEVYDDLIIANYKDTYDKLMLKKMFIV
jgi:hypothetical protein